MFLLCNLKTSDAVAISVPSTICKGAFGISVPIPRTFNLLMYLVGYHWNPYGYVCILKLFIVMFFIQIPTTRILPYIGTPE